MTTKATEDLRKQLWALFSKIKDSKDGRGTVNHFFDDLIPFIEAHSNQLAVKAIKDTFPHLWGEYNSFSDERMTLEQDDSFASFFAHERVVKYLKTKLDTERGQK